MRSFLASFSPTPGDSKLECAYGAYTWDRMEQRTLPTYDGIIIIIIFLLFLKYTIEFYNELLGRNTFETKEDYERCVEYMQKEHGVQTFRDWMTVYGLADVCVCVFFFVHVLLIVGTSYASRGSSRTKPIQREKCQRLQGVYQFTIFSVPPRDAIASKR